MNSREIDIHGRLQRDRKQLLDLTGRNRLLNTSRSKSRSGRLDVVDEISSHVFSHLVLEQKSMSFVPRETDGDGEEQTLQNQTQMSLPAFEFESNSIVNEPTGLGQPEEDESQPAERHIDDRLQTALTSESLQKRLLKLFYDARTGIEEQGVNILYLAFGFLKWFEAKASAIERFAPLVLVPVELTRTDAKSRFRIRWNGDDITTNLSLKEKLRTEFGIALPELPADAADIEIGKYFEEISLAISADDRWQVEPNDMTLWLFSFAKFRMFADLDPTLWPGGRAIGEHPLIKSLLGDGFQNEPPIAQYRTG